MTAAQLGQWVVQALELGLWLALPSLLASLLAGALSAGMQALTGVSDAALAFVPKLLAVGAVLFFTGAWMMQRLTAFTLELWRALP
jgi:flagellar biosynthetic protein FliQ